MDEDTISIGSIGANGTSIHMANIHKILNSPEYREKLDDDTVRKLRDFQDTASQFGMGEDGFVHMSLTPGATVLQGVVELTRSMQAHMRGETTPYADY